MMSYGYEPSWSEGAIKSPIFQTSTFVFKSAEEGKAFFELAYGLREQGTTEQLGLIYSRLNNPDLEILEDRLTIWDEAEDAAAFTSGMSAIATLFFEFLRPGDWILHSQPLYGGTEHFLKHIVPRYGIRTASFVAGTPRATIEKDLERIDFEGRLGLIFAETPANPTNRLVDIAHCAELARRYSTKERRVVVAIDNTFLGPVWQHPIQHGADLVIYSATKYIGGHSDVIAGVCLGSRELLKRVKGMRTFLGTAAGPWTGWLLLRSLETLKLRMTCQMKNARYVADFLTDHPKVDRVYYLGHMKEDDPQFGLYRKQCSAPGAMIAFDIVG
ncbi:MAG: PLP-dependent transferase, partial [Planctomycetes bacterium]|nr:PLP-dependent transferase [Planctomycetota bacterium]